MNALERWYNGIHLYFFVNKGDPFVFHSYAYVSESFKSCREIAKAEGIEKIKNELRLLAVAFKDVGLMSVWHLPKKPERCRKSNYLFLY